MATSPGNAIRFQCPHCGGNVKAPPGQEGERFQCPRCGADILAPGAAAPQGDTSPTSSAAGNHSARRPATSGPAAEPHSAKPSASRPAPGGAVTQPANVKPAEPLPRRRPALQTPPAPAKKSKPAPKPVEFTIRCRVCETRLDATEDQIGKEIDCPDCHSKVLVRPYQKKTFARKSPPTALLSDADAEILLGELVERPRYSSTSQAGPTREDLEFISPAARPQETTSDDPPVIVFAKPAPTAPSPPNPLALPSVPEQFAQLCPVCGSMLYARREQIGHSIECSDCQRSFTIKPPPLPRLQQKIEASDSADDYQLQALDELPDQALPGQQPAAARRPPGAGAGPSIEPPPRLMEAPEKSIDSGTGGFARLQPADAISAAKPEAGDLGLAEPEVDGVSLGAAVDLAPKIDEYEKLAQEKLREAEDELNEHERDNPPLPKRPFIDGVFTFLFDPGAAFNWVAVATIMAVEVSVMSSIISVLFGDKGLAQVGAVMVIPFAALLTLVGVAWASIYCLYVMQDTASGFDKLENLPSVNVLDWLGESFYVLNTLAICALPAALLARMFAVFGLPMSVLMLVFMFPLFPILLMATVEAGSPLSFYSPAVFRSLKESTVAWLKFYALATPTAVLGCGSFALAIMTNCLVSILSCLVASAALLLYFRLLGRLAWVCTEEAADKAEARRNARLQGA